MKITISIECNTVAESQQILAQLNAQAPVGVQRNITIAKVDATGSDDEKLFTDLLPFIPDGVDDQPVKFGKYRAQGLTPRQLLSENPQYILWADDNIEWKPFSPEAVRAAQQVLGITTAETIQPATPTFAMFDDGGDDIPF